MLSNKVVHELVAADDTPGEKKVSSALWSRFCEEADISNVSKLQDKSVADAASEVKPSFQKLKRDAYDFVSRSDRTKLAAGRGKVERPKLVGVIRGTIQTEYHSGQLFQDLAQGSDARAVIRLTMV